MKVVFLGRILCSMGSALSYLQECALCGRNILGLEFVCFVLPTFEIIDYCTPKYVTKTGEILTNMLFGLIDCCRWMLVIPHPERSSTSCASGVVEKVTQRLSNTFEDYSGGMIIWTTLLVKAGAVSSSQL